MSRFRIWYSNQPRAIRALLTINVGAYLVWRLVFVHFEPTALFVYRHVALNPTLPGIMFEPWQLLTYSFLHLSPGLGGLLHILFNMLWMVWIGRDFEQTHGPHHLLSMYVAGGVGGGLLTVVLHAIFPDVGPFGGIVHGASGAVLGIMTAIAVLYPQRQIALLFIGVVRLIHVVFGFLFLDLLFLAGGGTSVSAHLGGVVTGFGFAYLSRAGIDMAGWARIFFPSGTRSSREGMLDRLEATLEARKRAKQKAGSQKRSRSHSERDDDPAPESAHSPSTQQVDRILDKISESGYDSLTAEEKRILFEASKDE